MTKREDDLWRTTRWTLVRDAAEGCDPDEAWRELIERYSQLFGDESREGGAPASDLPPVGGLVEVEQGTHRPYSGRRRSCRSPPGIVW